MTSFIADHVGTVVLVAYIVPLMHMYCAYHCYVDISPALHHPCTRELNRHCVELNGVASVQK